MFKRLSRKLGYRRLLHVGIISLGTVVTIFALTERSPALPCDASAFPAH
jgi:hypothetical protein